MRRQAKVDRNQPEIVRELRKIGASVQCLSSVGEGCPDLLVGFRGRTFLIEVKDGLLPPSRRRLNDDQKLWHSTWHGHVAVVETVEEALKAIQ